MSNLKETQNRSRVHSKIILLWMVHVKGCKVISKHREPSASMYGTIKYKTSWIVEQ